MSKQAKKKQTDYTIGGRDISNTAIPLYQANLQRMDNYLADPMAAQQKYLDTYYNANNVQNQDFLRGYQRAMGNTTANNYASTQGGYSSAGNRAYTDQQRYYNDLASRLQDYGVQSSYTMADNDYKNMVGANESYQNAYSLGKAYSDVDQYNDLVKQANKNWIGNIMNSAGQAGMSSGNPWGIAIGAALSTGGNMMQTDTSNAMASIYGDAGKWNGGTNTLGNTMDSLSKVDWGQAFSKWKNKGNSTNANFNPNVTAGTNQFGLGTDTINNINNMKFSWQT